MADFMTFFRGGFTVNRAGPDVGRSTRGRDARHAKYSGIKHRIIRDFVLQCKVGMLAPI
jgi:hypothetical protein